MKILSEPGHFSTSVHKLTIYREGLTNGILPILSILLIVLVSCETAQKGGDTARDIDLPAAYSGEIPCADCPGILSTIILEKKKFTEIRHYRDRTPTTFIERGFWGLNGDTLLLKMDDGSIRTKLLFDEGSLIILDRSGERIEGELAENYILDYRPEMASIWVQHRNDYENGVTYQASGNEPFWGIRIYQENRLLFSEPGDSLRFESISIERENKKRIRVDAENDSASLNLTLENRLCRDSMSGALFSYSSQLIISKISSEPDTLTGCGSDLTQLYSGE